MAKGQQRGNRETKKPKANKKAAVELPVFPTTKKPAVAAAPVKKG
jgi:hypothetical protein